MQPHPEHMVNKATQRTIGTLIARIYALAVLLIDQNILMKHVELTGTSGQLDLRIFAAVYLRLLHYNFNQ